MPTPMAGPAHPMNFFHSAFPFMPVPPPAGASTGPDGLKAIECLMSLLVDEMKDVKRGLVGLQQEFSEMRLHPAFAPMS